jgi:hypothetical protein
MTLRLQMTAAVLLATGLLVSCSSREKTAACPPLPSRVELSLGERTVFRPKRLKGGDTYHFVSGRNGSLWVLLQEMSRPLMAARLEKGLKPDFEPISPEGWAGVGRVSVSNTRQGDPVVFMMGYLQDARDSRVVVREWGVKGWGGPFELDAFDGSGTFGSMVSLLDSKGRVHVVYDRCLTPRESYGIAAGYFPDKCFHSWSDGEQWTRSQSTTGRGRFYVDPVSLSDLPDGTVCLAARVHPFSIMGYEEGYVGRQLWDGERWSDIIGQLPDQASVDAGAKPIRDHWGNSISWTCEGGRYTGSRRKRGAEGVKSFAMLSEPLMVRDREGRIIVCSSDSAQCEVRVWEGDQWAGQIRYPLDRGEGISRVLCNPDGNLLLIHEGDSRIVVRRVTLAPRTPNAGSRD